MSPTPDGGKMGGGSDQDKNHGVAAPAAAHMVSQPPQPLPFAAAASKAAAVVLSDPAMDLDYLPGPGPGPPNPVGTQQQQPNALVLPPKKASPPPYSVLLPPPVPSPSPMSTAAVRPTPSPYPQPSSPAPAAATAGAAQQQQQQQYSSSDPISGLLTPSSSGLYPSVPLATNGSSSSSPSPSPGSSFTSTFLRGMLTSIDSKDPVVANAWLETLMDTLDLLDSDSVRREVAPVAVARGQLSRPPDARRAACRLLGKIATKLDTMAVRQDVLPTALSLCQDPEAEVRRCMCRQLAHLARGLGAEAARSALLPQLVELAADEEACVRAAAAEAAVQVMPLLDEDARRAVMAPLVIKSCDQATQLEDESLPVIAHYLGRLCHGLGATLSQEQRTWFVDYYKKLSTIGTHTLLKKEKEKAVAAAKALQQEEKSGSPPKPMPDLVPAVDQDKSFLHLAVRRECAANFPAMALFAGGSAKFSSPGEPGLRTTLNDLACDGAWQVRRALASGLHELARILGPAFASAKAQVCTLFADDRVEVLEAMVANLVHAVDALARHGVLQFGGGPGQGCANSYYAEELARALLKCESVVGATRDWRLHADCLEKFSCLANCLSPGTVQGRFVPLLFERMLRARPQPCRNAAARTLLIILRFTIRSSDRSRISDRLRSDLARGRSCHHRMLFLRTCDMAASLFSRAHFKRHFFADFLSLSADAVANVRLRLCASLPRLKGLLSLPSDRSLLHRLEDTVKQMLSRETDRDVLDALRRAIEGMESAEVGVDGVPSMKAAEDREDERKLREERLISSMEEQLGKIAAATAATTAVASAESTPVIRQTPSAAVLSPQQQQQQQQAAMARQRSDLSFPSTASELQRRTRSESLPPALSGRGIPMAIPGQKGQQQQQKYLPPDPPPRAAFSTCDLSDLLPSSSWKRDEDRSSSTAPGSSSSPPLPQRAAPYSSSLENLDPSAKEFLVDAGVTLDAASFSSTPNLASSTAIESTPASPSSSAEMPSSSPGLPPRASSVDAVGRNPVSSPPGQPRPSASVGDLSSSSSSSDGDYSKFLISNEEMKRYEEEYQRASEEVTSQIKKEKEHQQQQQQQQQQHRRGRPESKLRPPGGRLPQPQSKRSNIAVMSPSSRSMSTSVSQASTSKSTSSSSALPRFSLQSKLASSTTDKIQDSIDKMAEKWEAKRKALVSTTTESASSQDYHNQAQQQQQQQQQRQRQQLFQEKRSASVDSVGMAAATASSPDNTNSHLRAAIMEQRLQTLKQQGLLVPGGAAMAVAITRRAASVGVPVPASTSMMQQEHVMQQPHGKRLSLTDQLGLQPQFGRGHHAVSVAAHPKRKDHHHIATNVESAAATRDRVDNGSARMGDNLQRKHHHHHLPSTSSQLSSSVFPYPNNGLSSPVPSATNQQSSPIRQQQFSGLSPPRVTDAVSLSTLVQSPVVASSSSLVVKPVSESEPPPRTRAIPTPPQAPNRPRPPPPPTSSAANRPPHPHHHQTPPMLSPPNRVPPQQQGHHHQSQVPPPPTRGQIAQGQQHNFAGKTRRPEEVGGHSEVLPPPPYQRPPQYGTTSKGFSYSANNGEVDIRLRQINQQETRGESAPPPPPPSPRTLNYPVPPPPAPSSPPPLERRGGSGGQVSINAIRGERERRMDEPISPPPPAPPDANTGIMSSPLHQQRQQRFARLPTPKFRSQQQLPQSRQQQQQQQQQQQYGRRPLSHQEQSSSHSINHRHHHQSRSREELSRRHAPSHLPHSPSSPHDQDLLSLQSGHRRDRKSLSAENILDSPGYEEEEEEEEDADGENDTMMGRKSIMSIQQQKMIHQRRQQQHQQHRGGDPTISPQHHQFYQQQQHQQYRPQQQFQLSPHHQQPQQQPQRGLQQKRMSQNSDGSSRSSSPQSSASGGPASSVSSAGGGGGGGGPGTNVPLTPDSLENDDVPKKQQVQRIPGLQEQRMAGVGAERRSSGLRMWQGQQQNVASPRSRPVAPTAPETNSSQLQSRLGGRSSGLAKPQQLTRQKLQHHDRRSPSPSSANQKTAGGMTNVTATTTISSSSSSNLTRGRPMVTNASRLRRPTVTTAATTPSSADPTTPTNTIKSHAVTSVPLTQTTKRLYQRNSYGGGGGGSVPSSPVKAAIAHQQQQGRFQQQQQTRTSFSAQSSPGGSRSASPHQLRQLQQHQQQLRRHSANYVQDDEVDGPPQLRKPGSMYGGARQASSPASTPSKMPQQQFQHHSSQPQLSRYQQQQQQQAAGGGGRLLYSSQQQLSRGGGAATGVPQGSRLSYQHQLQQQRNSRPAEGSRVTRQQQQQQQSASIPVPTSVTSRPRSYGLPAPGFSSSRQPGGGGGYGQKSM